VDGSTFGVAGDATVFNVEPVFGPRKGVGPDRKEATVRLPVDTSAMTLVAMAPPEPVVDFATRAPKADANGLPL
jgi:hypothetical protein